MSDDSRLKLHWCAAGFMTAFAIVYAAEGQAWMALLCCALTAFNVWAGRRG